MKYTIITILSLLGCLVILGGIIMVSGIYNISARVPHWKMSYLLLEGFREQSVSLHSRGIKVLPNLTDPVLVHKGFPHFHDMCRLCHGAPGYARSEFAEGLYPHPPDLSSDEIKNEITDRELFWIVQNGLKMTGMPAFGDTHTEDQIWSIIAIIRELPRLDEKAYKEIAEDRRQHHGE